MEVVIRTIFESNQWEIFIGITVTQIRKRRKIGELNELLIYIVLMVGLITGILMKIWLQWPLSFENQVKYSSC